MSFKRQLKEWCTAILIAVAVACVMYAVCWPVMVEGVSMEDSFFTGDRLLICRAYTFVGSIKRGDVVVCKNDGFASEKAILKRVIGLPGEEVSISGGSIYINGEELDEPGFSGITSGQMDVKLGGDEYFVLGDNRDNSLDSRSLGAFNKKDIIGLAFFRWYPFDKFGVVNNRFG